MPQWGPKPLGGFDWGPVTCPPALQKPPSAHPPPSRLVAQPQRRLLPFHSSSIAPGAEVYNSAIRGKRLLLLHQRHSLCEPSKGSEYSGQETITLRLGRRCRGMHWTTAPSYPHLTLLRYTEHACLDRGHRPYIAPANMQHGRTSTIRRIL
ncbi:uncharacterized protein B0I36DRAFT_138264 [Microdochium trichocladiopsis]|uniref:Uncharacterized protein n=1 Tax=Microdochium trichocladiopsis TaxID=1682393 RepID=A0A9P9BKV1_9PEZI|nr:uncharacterized protein B0I36DRAFT_138264 [Microdochium trichocladiopsis]KAH7027412.1 hypothetical protein B0I36DRAFT_138264 [Microdochium trichocladiopsis]